MISKFNGRCKGCGKPYAEGDDIFWTKEDGAWHHDCRDALASKPDLEAFKLADRLGFIRPADPVPSIWFTWGSQAPVRESETLSLFE